MRNPSAKTRFFCGVALLLLASSAAALIGAANSFGYDDSGKKLRIVFVTSAGPGNPFYGPIIKGFDQAGKDLGVDAVFRGDQKTTGLGAAPEMKRRLEGAIAAKPDGLVIANFFPNVLNDTIRTAVKSGIPVVLSNGGFGEVSNTGALAFVGTDERQLGLIGGQLLREAGARKALILVPPPGIPVADLRLQGFSAGILPSEMVKVEVPADTFSNATKLVNTMLVAIQKDPDIDAVFSIGSCCGPAMVTVREQLGARARGMHFGTIDLGGPVLTALKDGKIDFAIDQQQYLEGYIPVLLLAQHLRYDLTPVSKVYLTGPGVVTRENAAKMLALEAQNIR
jgi:simple sugar transport system substrate-binding protein